MKTVFIHPGMHKTGTTSIQHTLYANRDVLLEYGINYLHSEANHSHGLYSLFGPAPHEFFSNLQRGIDSPKKVAVHNERVRATIEAACRENRSPAFVISAEAICDLSVDGLQRFESLLAPHFDRVLVTAYVRPPRSYITSAAQQWIKRGYCLDDVLRDPPVPDYRRRFENLRRVFGAENVSFTLYVRQRLKNHCAVASFLERIGAPDELYQRLQVVDTNESLSLTAAKLLSVANRRVPRFAGRKPNPERAAALLSEISRIPGPRFRLPEQWLSDVIASVQPDIAWMEATLGVALEEPTQTGETPSPAESNEVCGHEDVGTIVEWINRLLNEKDSRTDVGAGGPGHKAA